MVKFIHTLTVINKTILGVAFLSMGIAYVFFTKEYQAKWYKFFNEKPQLKKMFEKYQGLPIEYLLSRRHEKTLKVNGIFISILAVIYIYLFFIR